MASPLALQFVRSASAAAQLPDSRVELALVGRSNVGKSTLINALANQKKLAKTSKTPGATRLINTYALGDPAKGRFLIDLPGYGFAKAPKAEMAKWATMIEEYLTEREQLAGALLLIDAEVGPTRLDLETVEWLQHIDLPMSFIATKADKVRPSKSKARRKDLVAKLGVEKSDVTWVSAAKGTGLPELRGQIDRLLTP